jgi:hypothetical protein
MKTCTKCGEEKSLEEYTRVSKGKDLLRSHCDDCRKRAQKTFEIDTSIKSKVCTGCKKDLEVSNFFKNLHRRGGLSHTCKVCSRDSYLKRKYRVSLATYNKMLKEQDYSCWICIAHVDDHYKENLHVDHDHSTGEVRGLLCESCNLLLGKARDSVAILENAIKYLNK